MAFVGDDEIEFLDGKRGIVFHRDGLLEERTLTPSPSPIRWARVAPDRTPHPALSPVEAERVVRAALAHPA
jgi:hypothetical protein